MEDNEINKIPGATMSKKNKQPTPTEFENTILAYQDRYHDEERRRVRKYNESNRMSQNNAVVSKEISAIKEEIKAIDSQALRTRTWRDSSSIIKNYDEEEEKRQGDEEIFAGVSQLIKQRRNKS